MREKGRGFAVRIGAILFVFGIAGAATAGERANVGDREVVTGTWSCVGDVYTDDQAPRVTSAIYWTGTSDVVAHMPASYAERRDQLADLDALDGQCAEHVDAVRAAVPRSCVVSSIEEGMSVFGNGTSVFRQFRFTCEGDRDSVIRAIGSMTRQVMAFAP